MKNCQLCDKELIHVEGRKQKSFCNVNCRNKYFYKKNKELMEVGKKHGIVDVAKEVANDIGDFGMAITEHKDGKTTRIDPLSDKGIILQQIASIKSEKCPDYAKSTIAKSVWENNKQKRIAELQKQLVTPIPS